LGAASPVGADELADLKRKVSLLQEELAALNERIGQLESHRVEEADQLHWKWKDGVRFETNDGEFKFKLTGRLMTDFSVSREDDNIQSRVGAKVEDAAEVRRARLGFKGHIYNGINFETEADLTGGVELKDAFIEFEHLPYASGLRIGQFKEPFSLEELTSSKYITFMERGLPNALAPGRNIGVMLFAPALQQRMTWAAGIFRDTNEDTGSEGSTGGGEYNLTARVTGLPWYQADGERLLHVGTAYSRRAVNANTVRYRSRPEVHLSPRLVDTGSFTADNVHLFGQEAALVHGPLSLQGEWITAAVDSSGSNRNDPTLFGFYAYASYFLTGEQRRYDREAGEFDRVKPLRNFALGGSDSGPGAWEVALRYSTIDLSSAKLNGRELRNFTAGLNWYLNPNTRTMLNYVFADLEGPGELNTVQARFQVDF
jgi:phosphate-selective porin OprO/OprP